MSEDVLFIILWSLIILGLLWVLWWLADPYEDTCRDDTYDWIDIDD